MQSNENTSEFSVFGGPFHRFGQRLGLIKNGTDSARFGLILGLSIWSIMLIMAVIRGSTSSFFSLDLFAGHIRFLIVIPMFFICEGYVAPRMADFVDYLIRSGLITVSEMPELAELIKKINKAKNSWIPESLLFIIVFVLPLLFPNSPIFGHSGSTDYIIKLSGGKITLLSGLYIWVCIPLFRFLLLRWIWHLCLWWYFLIQLNKIKLNLIPTHSDDAGGLGYLESVHEYFAPFGMTISFILAASSAEEIILKTQPFEYLYPVVASALGFSLLFFVAPLFIFYKKLKQCRLDGLKEYMILSSRYVDAFDKKWIKDKNIKVDSLLGEADIQSLADITSSVNIIQDMRLAPITKKLLILIVLNVIIPFVPFVFLKFNAQELMSLILKLIMG